MHTISYINPEKGYSNIKEEKKLTKVIENPRYPKMTKLKDAIDTFNNSDHEITHRIIHRYKNSKGQTVGAVFEKIEKPVKEKILDILKSLIRR